ncbi:MAG: DMT family transporter [Pseudomonadota bacterium]
MFLYIVFLIALGTLWGLQFSLLKIANIMQISELVFLVFTLLSLTLIYNAILFIKRQNFHLTVECVRYFFISGSLGYVLPLGVALHLSDTLSAGSITLLASSAPVITVILSTLIGHERMNIKKMLGVVMGFSASILVLWPLIESLFGNQNSHFENAQPLDLLIALIIPLAYGFDVVYISAFWPKNLNATQVVAGETGFAGLFLLPFFFIFEDPGVIFHLKQETWLPILAFIIVSIFEIFLFFYLIRKTGPIFVANGGYVALIAGVVWGIVLFDEQHGLHLWFASILLVIAIWCVLPKKEKHPSLNSANIE